MHRKDLVVGAELYYARERDWATPKYGSGRGEMVKVLAVEPWEDRPYYGMRDSRPMDERLRACEKGNGVLIERRIGGQPPWRDIVSLAHLKGPYAATHATVSAWVRKRDEAKATAEDQRLDRRSRASVAAASIDVRPVDLTYNGRSVTLDLATFEAMAAALAELGWRYEQ
jgi:hypothetical protein